MTNYPLLFAIQRKDDKYLADSFHHTRWTDDLRAARLHLNYIDAAITAEREDGRVRYVSLVEDIVERIDK